MNKFYYTMIISLVCLQTFSMQQQPLITFSPRLPALQMPSLRSYFFTENNPKPLLGLGALSYIKNINLYALNSMLKKATLITPYTSFLLNGNIKKFVPSYNINPGAAAAKVINEFSKEATKEILSPVPVWSQKIDDIEIDSQLPTEVIEVNKVDDVLSASWDIMDTYFSVFDLTNKNITDLAISSQPKGPKIDISIIERDIQKQIYAGGKIFKQELEKMSYREQTHIENIRSMIWFIYAQACAQAGYILKAEKPIVINFSYGHDPLKKFFGWHKPWIKEEGKVSEWNLPLTYSQLIWPSGISHIKLLNQENSLMTILSNRNELPPTNHVMIIQEQFVNYLNTPFFLKKYELCKKYKELAALGLKGVWQAINLIQQNHRETCPNITAFNNLKALITKSYTYPEIRIGDEIIIPETQMAPDAELYSSDNEADNAIYQTTWLLTHQIQNQLKQAKFTEADTSLIMLNNKIKNFSNNNLREYFTKISTIFRTSIMTKKPVPLITTLTLKEFNQQSHSAKYLLNLKKLQTKTHELFNDLYTAFNTRLDDIINQHELQISSSVIINTEDLKPIIEKTFDDYHGLGLVRFLQQLEFETMKSQVKLLKEKILEFETKRQKVHDLSNNRELTHKIEAFCKDLDEAKNNFFNRVKTEAAILGLHYPKQLIHQVKPIALQYNQLKETLLTTSINLKKDISSLSSQQQTNFMHIIKNNPSYFHYSEPLDIQIQFRIAALLGLKEAKQSVLIPSKNILVFAPSDKEVNELVAKGLEKSQFTLQTSFSLQNKNTLHPFLAEAIKHQEVIEKTLQEVHKINH